MHNYKTDRFLKYIANLSLMIDNLQNIRSMNDILSRTFFVFQKKSCKHIATAWFHACFYYVIFNFN